MIVHVVKYFLLKLESLNSTSKTHVEEPGVEANTSKAALERLWGSPSVYVLLLFVNE